MEPLDQFRAFRDLVEKGRTEEEVAAAFFVSVSVVKQRLRLAAVSPRLLDVYAEDGMTLDQLMAFAVNPDHERQEQVWEAVQRSHNKEPYFIRRLLTEGGVRASDKRAQFVGIEAYESAGGDIMRDLFQQDDGGWLQDPVLLERLVAEKLEREADNIRSEGWKWVEIAIDFPYGHTYGLRRISGESVAMTDEEVAAAEALRAEHERLEQEHSDVDVLPEAIDQRLGEIETALAELDERPVQYDPDEIARAGAFCSIDASGVLRIDRGYVRPEDEPTIPEPEREADTHSDGTQSVTSAPADVDGAQAVTSVAEAEAEQEDGIKPIPDRLMTELTAYRTLALRDALGREPSIAFQAVLHSFVLATFYPFGSTLNCLEISLRTPSFPAQPPGLQDSVPAKAIAARHASWKAKLPASDKDLWAALTAMDRSAQAALFAHCASQAVNAIFEPANRVHQGRLSAHGVRGRLDQAERLSRAVGLDMVSAGWKPTVDNYLGRVTKHRILQTVREAKGEASVQLIAHLKKPDMAREAERLLDGSRWLPEPLRGAEADITPAVEGADADSLPAFLNEDEEATEGADEVEEIVAAE
ncbi:MAG: chromosome partitioning protein ParB [Bradyrhizobium sp.]|nr:chromosome partitioning protein ParB [Bradyrhizobium sp.]